MGKAEEQHRNENQWANGIIRAYCEGVREFTFGEEYPARARRAAHRARKEGR